jgi:hypothetical protein
MVGLYVGPLGRGEGVTKQERITLTSFPLAWRLSLSTDGKQFNVVMQHQPTQRKISNRDLLTYFLYFEKIKVGL